MALKMLYANLNISIEWKKKVGEVLNNPHNHLCSPNSQAKRSK